MKQEVRNEFDNPKETLATKEDILNLRIDMEKAFRDNLKWCWHYNRMYWHIVGST